MSRSSADGVVHPRLAGRSTRWLWLCAAYLALACAIVGAVLPVLPTTPFALLAAFAAARSSPRLHGWLLSHRLLGPVIADWERERAVSRRAKYTAIAMMLFSALIVLLVAPLVSAIATSTIMLAVATWLWRRPEPTPRGPHAG